MYISLTLIPSFFKKKNSCGVSSSPSFSRPFSLLLSHLARVFPSLDLSEILYGSLGQGAECVNKWTCEMKNIDQTSKENGIPFFFFCFSAVSVLFISPVIYLLSSRISLASWTGHTLIPFADRICLPFTLVCALQAPVGILEEGFYNASNKKCI